MKLKILMLILSLMTSTSFAQDRLGKAGDVTMNSTSKAPKTYGELKSCGTSLHRAVHEAENGKAVRRSVLSSDSKEEKIFTTIPADNSYMMFGSNEFGWKTYLIDEDGVFTAKDPNDFFLFMKLPKSKLEAVNNHQEAEEVKKQLETHLSNLIAEMSDSESSVNGPFLSWPGNKSGVLTKAEQARWKKALCDCRDARFSADKINSGIKFWVHKAKMKVRDEKTQDLKALQERDFECEFQAS